jgi:hypothetical protein
MSQGIHKSISNVKTLPFMNEVKVILIQKLGQRSIRSKSNKSDIIRILLMVYIKAQVERYNEK